MAALSVQVPYPVFYDRDGQPLDGGRIYIGQANLDPVTNPIATYYDDALTIPAAQPLITSNGYVYRNGTPAQIYVDAVNFSILVNDNKGLLVYSFPEGTGISPNASGVAFTGFKGQNGFVSDLADNDGSDWIGFDQGDPNAIARSAQDKMRDTVSVKDFGAVGDGSTDDTIAFQNALDSGVLVYVPYSANGYVVGELTITNPGGLIGDDNRTLIKIAAATNHWLTIQSSNVSLGNFKFTQGANCTGGLVYIDTAVAQYEKFRINNIVTESLAGPFLLDADSSHSFDELYVSNITVQKHGASAVKLRDAYAFIFITQFAVDLFDTVSPNHTFFDIQNAQGTYLTRCEVSGSAYVGATNSTQVGFDIRNCSSVFLNTSFADTCGGKGWYISGCTYVHLLDVSASICDGIGITFNNTTFISGTEIFILGRNYLANKTASVSGLVVENACNNVRLSNLMITNATGDNILVDNTTADNRFINIGPGNVLSATGYGVKTSGTTTNPSCLFCDLVFADNVAGDYSLANSGGGTGFDRIAGAQINSGAYANVGSQIFYGSGTTNTTKSVSVRNSAGTEHFFVRDDGPVNALGSYSNTTGSAANMFIGNDGYIYRSTSSLKYKSDIQPYARGLADVLALRPVSFKDKQGEGNFAGLIAEDLHAAGLTEFVAYADDGTPDAIHYPNMVALLVKAIQELADR